MVATLLSLSFFLTPLSSFAACTQPEGPTGAMVFNTNTKAMQYCNGTSWVNAGASIPTAATTGCSNPTGPMGGVIYNGTLGVIQFCNGESWVDTACASARSPNGSGCTTPTGKAGDIIFETTSAEAQFCDSTHWVAMGWPCAGASTGLLNWSFVQKLLATGTINDSDLFSAGVDIDGETMVVGAPRQDTPATDAGYAYVFTRSGGTWSLQAKLQPAGAAANWYVGESVALDSNTLLLGVNNEPHGGGAYGWVYIYTRSGSTWSQQAKIRASDYSQSKRFGYTVALQGDTAIIGDATFNNLFESPGAIYVFKRTGTSWAQQAKLAVSDAAAGDMLGEMRRSVVVKGDTAIIGSHNRNAVYVFTRSGTTWTQQAKLIPSDGTTTGFGSVVALEGTTLVIGNPQAGSNKGVVYVYTGSGATWSQQARFEAADGEASDTFGESLSLSGNNLVVGATGDDDAGSNAGAAYFYQRNGSNWVFQKKVASQAPQTNGYFGRYVGLSGQTAIISGQSENTGRGAAYIFTP